MGRGMLRKTELNSRERGERNFSALLLVCCLAFYVFFALLDGAVIAVDSQSYIDMEVSREPLYPLLLASFRVAFSGLVSAGVAGEAFYLDAAAFCQSLLMAFAVWALVRYLQRCLDLSRLLTLLLLAVPLFVSLLCRFAAARGAMYSNHILTEGITIPLYLLFFRFLLEFCLERTRRSGVWCLILSFLLYSTRKQMLIALAMWMLCVFAVHILSGQNNEPPAGSSRSGSAPSAGVREGDCGAAAADGCSGSAMDAAAGRKDSLCRRLLRGLAAALLSAAVVLGGSTFFDMGYNFILRGEAVRHTSDARFLTTMAFYTAEREDAQYIEDEELRELFLSIYDICDEQGYLMHSAGEGWLARVTHFGDNYDNIQINTMWPMINSYVGEDGSESVLRLNLSSDDVMDVFNAALLPHNIGKVLRCCADNFLSGLVTTVAQRKGVLIVYSVLVYLLYLILLASLALRRRCGKICLFALLTLLSIVCNVGLVSLVIFCQTRYTIYNMPLFYISLILMLHAALTAGRSQEHHSAV